MSEPFDEDLDTPPPPATWWTRWGRGAAKALGAVALALVLMQVVGWLRAPDLPDEAPPFTLADLDGRPVALADFRGQPVVLNFWATWCGPCRLEAPAFSRFAANHPEVAVLGIAADGPAPKLRRAAEELGITYTVLQGDRATLSAYGISSFPTTVVLDADGRVVTAHVGVLLDPQLEVMSWLP